MSAQLSTYKRFLSKYATKLETVLTRFKNEGLETIKFPDEETTPLSINENQRLLEEGIGAIETCNTKIQETLQNYAIALDKNGSLSEKELDDFELYSNKVETVFSSSLDYIVLLKGRLNAFTSYQGARASRITSNNNAESEGALGVKKIELPTLPIPTFYGNVWEWDIWTLFDANVNSQPLPDLYKFNYLIKALRGEPLQAVKKFRVSQDNYEKAVIFLKTKYGDKEQLINQLYERLERLHLNSPSIRDQRKLLEQVQTIVAQLQEKNEHVDNQCMIKQVLSKFPNKLQRKVLERKYTQTENTFGMEILLKLLEEFITTEEKVSLFTREATPKQHPVSPAFPKVKEESTRWINNCMYCGEDHKAIACTKYTTPQSRAQYLREHKLCFICASPKHITTNCKKRMCFVCQGPHHTSCCFKKGQANENSPNTYRRPKEEKSKDRKSPYPQPKQQKTPHPPQPKPTRPTSTTVHQTSEEAGMRKEPTAVCELHSFKQSSKTNPTYLPTGQLLVMDPNTKNLRKIPVLLDTGAELSFIDTSLAEELHLPTIKTTKLRLSTFGSDKVNESLSRKVELDAWDAEGNVYQLQLLTYNTLTKPLKTPPLLDEDIRFMQSLNLNVNVATTQESKPLILLGCDQLWQLVKEGTAHIRLPSGLHLLPTKLGHLPTGQIHESKQILQVDNEDTESTTWDAYWTLEAQVNGIVDEISDTDESDEKERWENYWTLEKEGTEEFSNSEKEAQAKIDQQVWDNFKKTVERRKDGYYVRLPWREFPAKLPDNRPIAFKRLISVWNSLQKNTQLLEQYNEVFQNQMENDIIEDIRDEQQARGQIIHYIPHQAVITPQKTTTKLRIVFDASAHFKNQQSLNDALFRGPVILPKLFGILLRFRIGKIAMISDVEKAFLQVRLHEEDRDATRCLWLWDHRKPPNEQNVRVFRFTRVTFGLLCSPFLLAATTHFHLDQYAKERDLAEEIKKNLYVDNLILTMDTPIQAMKIYKNTKEIFKELKMNLREFGSNCREALMKMSPQDRTGETTMKVLGVPWDTGKDSIQIGCTVKISDNLTKRHVASAIAAIYDPMGWLLPLTHKAKVYLQALWRNQVDWDEPLSPERKTEWLAICQKMQGFSKQMPRVVALRGTKASVISFADASSEAMATCTYLRTQQNVNLMMAKAKLPSIKTKPTIPKMELNAITLSMRLTNAVITQIGQIVTLEEAIILTDSEIALSWITTSAKQETSPFIRNRVREIKEIRNHLQEQGYTIRFGHVNSQLNPADCATRGLSQEDLQHHFWWTGPQFLTQPQQNWESILRADDIDHKEETMEETPEQSNIPKEISGQVNQNLEDAPPEYEDVFKELHSHDLVQIKCVVAYVLRFIRTVTRRANKTNKRNISLSVLLNAHIETHDKSLTGKEIQIAHKVLIKQHQLTRVIPRIVQACQKLNLTKDREGIIRCKGRLAESKLSTSAKFPILVLQNTWLAQAIIREQHKIGHKSTSHTMASVRQRYWIPKLRAQVTKIIRNCIPCQKMNNLPYRYPEQSDLPERRVVRTRPFENVGLDYFGPLSITNDEGVTTKAYGAIITCLVTRLIHLDIVKDVSTEAFLNMMRRFFARRGTPKSITSDNAPTFILADTILQECHHQAMKNPVIAKEISKKEIDWKYITPYAPWQGGVYERLIKSVKLAMYKSLGKTTPSYDELQTTITEIEGILNTRPLTYVESDPEDRILRPIDFLQNEFEIPYPLDVDKAEEDPEYLSPEEQARLLTKTKVLQAIQSSCKLTEKFWQQWQYEYLTALRETHKREVFKKRSTKDLPRTGKVVLIVDSLQPRYTWKMGRIEDLVANKEGTVREAVIRLPSHRKIRRPINLLVPLELEDSKQEIEDNNPPTETDLQHPPQDTRPSRYDLRPRNKDVRYTANITTNGMNFITFIALALMMLVTGGKMAPVEQIVRTRQTIRCTLEGVEVIIPQRTPYQICVEEFCKTLENPQLREVLIFPPQITLHDYEVHWKILENHSMTTVETKCPATSFCAKVDCIFCTTLIFNPECWPLGAIIASGFMLYLLFIGCYAFMYVPMILGRPFRAVLSIVWQIVFFIWRKTRGARTRRYRPSAADLIELLAVFALLTVKETQACQQVNIFSHQATICTKTGQGHLVCHVQLSEVLKINPFKREACFRLTKNGTALHEVRATWKSLQLTCQQVTDYFSREVSYNVIDSKRCPHVGTCIEPKCRAINTTALIPELEQGNKYPGSTYCGESCGGPGCDCFYWSSGCLFYRIYFIPKSTQIFEIFHCNHWKEAAKVELTHLDSSTGKSETYTALMQPNIPVNWGPFSLTLSSITVPPIPLLNTHFITNNNETALWDKKGTLPLRCANRTMAESLQCEVRDECTCYPAETKANCKCPETEIASVLQNLQKRLPADTPLVRFQKTEEGAIEATIPAMTTSEIILNIQKDLETDILTDQVSCTLNDAILTGCYKCAQGATAQVRCTATRKAYAEITCGDASFSVECDENGIESTLRFSFEQARVQKTCTVSCGQQHTQFEIAGILKFTHTLQDIVNRWVNGNTNEYSEIEWPDFSHILDVFMQWYKTLICVVIICLSIIAITYIALSTCGPQGVYCLLRLPFRLLKITVRCCIFRPLLLIVRIGQHSLKSAKQI